MAGISVTGTATSADGSVTVEVGLGGSLRSIRLTKTAVNRGAAHLAGAILEAARQATARANHQAHREFCRLLGPSAEHSLRIMGLDYDPALVDDEGSSPDDPLGWR